MLNVLKIENRYGHQAQQPQNHSNKTIKRVLQLTYMSSRAESRHHEYNKRLKKGKQSY